jgi:2-polyprenyl-3-methyl-5-hydroxy-6-metoxy-1,4-benzoquinol methylase
MNSSHTGQEIERHPAAPVGLTSKVGPMLRLPDDGVLRQVFHLKYGAEGDLGWGPRLRRSYGYHNPDDWYESLLAALVFPGVHWLDVGCGRDLFPSNRALAAQLAKRAGRLVGLDPDPTLDENPFVHERIRSGIDDYDGGHAFDLITLRMVAEHIDDPAACARSIERSLRPGGLCVVYTVYSGSPMPLLTRLAPMGLRHVIKRWLWNTEEKDTFPTRFQMNTRGKLRRLFEAVGMREEAFLRLDDCRTFAKFRWACQQELRLRAACHRVGLPYPEHCIVGVYRRS